MTDNRFEDRLEALFDTPPALDGDLSFAVGVQQRVVAERGGGRSGPRRRAGVFGQCHMNDWVEAISLPPCTSDARQARTLPWVR